MARRYRAGGIGYREAKDRLFDALEHEFARHRVRYDELLQDPDRSIRCSNRERSEPTVRATVLDAVRAAVGLAA